MYKTLHSNHDLSDLNQNLFNASKNILDGTLDGNERTFDDVVKFFKDSFS